MNWSVTRPAMCSLVATIRISIGSDKRAHAKMRGLHDRRDTRATDATARAVGSPKPSKGLARATGQVHGDDRGRKQQSGEGDAGQEQARQPRRPVPFG